MIALKRIMSDANIPPKALAAISHVFIFAIALTAISYIFIIISCRFPIINELLTH